MKRYGFKFEPLGSAHTKFEYIRFAIAVFAMVGVILSKIFSGEWFGNVYLLCWVIFTVISFASEAIKSLSIYPVMLSTFSALGAGCIYDFEIFGNTVSAYNTDTGWELIKRTNAEARTVFIFFNVAIIGVCCIYIYKQLNRHS